MPSNGLDYYFLSPKTASKPCYGHQGGQEGEKNGIPRVMYGRGKVSQRHVNGKVMYHIVYTHVYLPEWL
jgi:hypothetical protein